LDELVKSSYERLGGLLLQGKCCRTLTVNLPFEVGVESLGLLKLSKLVNVTPGMFVLDIGCGTGLDLLWLSRKVGRSGYVIGVDLAKSMVRIAYQRIRRTGREALILNSDILNLPLKDCSIHLAVSNCVLNLVSSVDGVLREVYRVLREEGQFYIADVVCESELPSDIRNDKELLVGCLAKARPVAELKEKMEKQGFTDVKVIFEEKFKYGDEDKKRILSYYKNNWRLAERIFNLEKVFSKVIVVGRRM
jgi:SAM-dependent methyltransferase